MSRRIHVFTGNTLPRTARRHFGPDIAWLPPAGPGDLIRLHCQPGDLVVILDTGLPLTPPPRHKEILALLARGITVIGASAGGAILAVELAPYGMTGHGWVHQAYTRAGLDHDDEVVGPAAHRWSTNRPVPLIVLRHNLALATDSGNLETALSTRILDSAEQLSINKRTMRAILRGAKLPLRTRHQVQRTLHRAWTDVRRQDADQLLHRLTGSRSTAPCSEDALPEPTWQPAQSSLYLRLLRAHAAPEPTNDQLLDVLRLFSPDFHVLQERCGVRQLAADHQDRQHPTAPTHPDHLRRHDLRSLPEHAYLFAAERLADLQVLSPHATPRHQIAPWLLQSELSLPAEQRCAIAGARALFQRRSLHWCDPLAPALAELNLTKPLIEAMALTRTATGPVTAVAAPDWQQLILTYTAHWKSDPDEFDTLLTTRGFSGRAEFLAVRQQLLPLEAEMTENGLAGSDLRTSQPGQH